MLLCWQGIASSHLTWIPVLLISTGLAGMLQVQGTQHGYALMGKLQLLLCCLSCIFQNIEAFHEQK